MVFNHKNKKAGIVTDFFLWVFASLMYFSFGYTLIKTIVTEVFLSTAEKGLIYYLVSFVPFIPILGLVWWGYRLGQGEPVISVDEGTGGGF